MKKLIVTAALAFAVLIVNAQLKVHSGGKVSIASTTSPSCSLYVAGLTGIGTTSPSNLLEVLQNQNARTGIEVENTTDGTAACTGFVLTGNSGNGAVLSLTSTSYTSVSGFDDALFLDAGTSVSKGLIFSAGATTGDINFYAGGRTSSDLAMTITDGTNVGIGTTNPAGKLEVLATSGSLGGNAIWGSTSGGGNGVIGQANSGVGGYFSSTSGYGLIVSSGNVGIGTTSPSYQLQLSTNSAAKPTSSAWTVPSDAQLKKDVYDFKDGLNILDSIHPVMFTYTGIAGMPKNETGIGTIAQELQKVAPYMVNTWTYEDTATKTKTNYLGVDYGAMDFILINSIKQQQKIIDTLKAHQKITDSLLTEVAKCCSGNRIQNNNNNEDQGKAPSVHELELANNCTLFQNYPNPFNDGTTIKYFIADNITDAQIIFLDEFGNKLKEFKVQEKGMGQLNISASNLSSGVYNYSLVVNGRVVETKKMLKNK